MGFRLGHKQKKFARLGAKVVVGAGALAGAALGVKQEADKFAVAKRAEQRVVDAGVFQGIAKDMGERGVPKTAADGSTIVKKTSPIVLGEGKVAPPPPPPPTMKTGITKVVGVAVGGASLKDELISAGSDYYQRSLSREEQEKNFRAAEEAKAKAGGTKALGGIGSTEASSKELLKLGAKKAKKKLTPSMPKNPFKYGG